MKRPFTSFNPEEQDLVEMEQQGVLASLPPQDFNIAPENSNETLVIEPEVSSLDVPSVELLAANDAGVGNELASLQDNADKMAAYGGLVRSFQNMLKNSMSMVNPRFEVDNTVADNLTASGRQRLNEFYRKQEEQRKGRDQKFDEAIRGQRIQDSALDITEKADFLSPQSKMVDVYKKFIKKMQPSIQDSDLDSMSPKRLEDFSRIIARQAELDQSRSLALANMNERAEDRRLRSEERKEQNQLKLEEKRNRDAEVDLQKFEKRSEDLRGVLQSIDNFENILGASLSSFSVDKNNNLKKDGKSVDLPGTSIPGLGRLSFYSGDARKLRSAADRIFNVELKDRSGAAVTDSELQRLRSEFNEGKFSTEADLIDAMRRYKNRAEELMRGIQAAYPKAIPLFKGRVVEPEPKKTPKANPGDIVKIKGKTYRVGEDGDSLEEVK